jgi:glutamate racemase
MSVIGMFDSGVGGLSVLKETRRLLPQTPVVYLADQEYGPYGDRSLDEVRRRANVIVERLLTEGATMAVIACHTASAAALHSLRRDHPQLQIVGIEPAVKPAAERTATRTVAVLATTATFQGELFASVVSRYAEDTRVIARPCPGLADLIENGSDEATLRRELAKHLEPLRAQNVDQIVLGCTHYSLIGDLISDLSGTEIVDPAPAVAAQVERVASGLPTAGGSKGEVRLLTTADPGRFSKRAAGILGEQHSVETIDI